MEMYGFGVQQRSVLNSSNQQPWSPLSPRAFISNIAAALDSPRSTVTFSEQHHRLQLLAQSGPKNQPLPFQLQQEPVGRRYRDQPDVATVLDLSAHLHTQSSFSSGYPQHLSRAITSNMMSIGPRRMLDDNNSPRQLMPSISGVMLNTRPGRYPPSARLGIQPRSSLPSPFPPVSRTYMDADKLPSPQHSASFPPHRQEGLPAFSDSPRPAFNNPFSLPPITGWRPTPPKADVLQHEAHPINGAYAHQQPPLPPPSLSYLSSQLPPGQVSLPRYPISSQHAASYVSGQYDPRGQPSVHPQADYSNRPRCDGASGSVLERWNYHASLGRIASAARTLFGEAYGRILQEQHGWQPISERLPTAREVDDMLANVELMKCSLDQVRGTVQLFIEPERSCEVNKAKRAYDEDVAIYGDGMKSQFSKTEVKERRVRAAAPGRCHSCNGIDTPEWRRGPDGARTLCNACGLHYAKLDRKRQLEAKSMRPKPGD